ncbi:hypothetical protein GCM10010389_54070 [Streptomyces echinoruber]|uniref:Uncharacterized protein n=1 Tax=Streptomyces echinoruber TaxID=68898 RepID=A0A918RSS8_9ACTN|nr:hypothetical protein GCM10010389_54070 [Streptomyces echinoruber]
MLSRLREGAVRGREGPRGGRERRANRLVIKRIEYFCPNWSFRSNSLRNKGSWGGSREELHIRDRALPVMFT